MKKLFLTFIISISLINNNYAQETTETKPRIGFRMFNMYVESAFGDSLAPDLASSGLKPCLDMKANYIHMLPNVPWLGFGFTAQFQYQLAEFQPGSLVPINPNEGKLPKSATIGAAIQLGPVSFGIDLTGKLSMFIFQTWKVPPPRGFVDNSITIILEQGIMVNGTGYVTKDGSQIMNQYIMTDGQLRFRYLMKPVSWFGLQLETVLFWFPVFHASGMVTDPASTMMMRFNPRFNFYINKNWSVFGEPRLFVLGLGKQNGFPGAPDHRLALEFKIGINYNMTWMD